MSRSFLLLFALLCAAPLHGADANRLTYLDEACDPYYPHREFAKLTTPQWVGEPDVECVVVLAIDDMRDVEKYETYLRPILDRLKQIDGRAPVSIMTCQVDPTHAHLQKWRKEGVSIEVHTFDHPCPCLAGSDFAKAKGTYDKCVDLMHTIAGNRPVAFRMPCCDSLNTPSPRFWIEAFNKTTPEGHYLSIDSSVFNIISGRDTSLPDHIRRNEQGEERFRRYVPFKSFVNTIEDYPYPYVIGGLCWQFPCVVPSDWSAQHVQKPNNPDTARDLKLALDACVLKQGVYNLVFHPHGWIRNDQVVELIDHAVAKHGRKVKFLNFQECDERLTKNLLAGHPLRDPHAPTDNLRGGDNGVRVLDVNGDGYMDVVIGQREPRDTNDKSRAGTTRVWDATKLLWNETSFPEACNAQGPRFGILAANGQASMLNRHGELWHFAQSAWRKQPATAPASSDQRDRGTLIKGKDARLRDLNHDGICEYIDASGSIFRWDSTQGSWTRLQEKLPFELAKVGSGYRFVDLDGDRDDDIVLSTEQQQGVWLFESLDRGWKQTVWPKGFSIPLISRQGTNNGAWFHSGHLWWQNEDTNRLPDHVDRRTFAQLLGEPPEKHSDEPVPTTTPKPTITPTDRKSAAGQEATNERIRKLGQPKSPAEALRSIVVKPGFKVELVAAEPLIVDPVAFDWGPDGRLWVVEMRDYPRGIDDQGKPGGRVKVLTDADNDGRYDEAKLFLDGLPYPTGIKVWQNGVLVTAAPDVIYAEDADGDGQADIQKVLYRGFGEGNQQHRVNGLRWSMDGWLYLGNGDSGGKIESLQTGATANMSGRDLRIRPGTGKLDPVSGATQYSLCFDDFGNRFGGNNSNPLWHYLVEDYQLRRNPLVQPPPTRQHVPSIPGNAPVFPLSKTVTRFNDYHTANRFTSACGIEIYRSRYLGDDYYGNSFVCEPVHNLIHREILKRGGVSFVSQRAPDEQDCEFLASSDNWFRPVMIRTGPDGALYIADMYRMVVEHPTWIPEDWQRQLNLRAGDDRGRIYRVVRADNAPPKLARLESTDSVGLLQALRSGSGTRRDLAQQLFLARRDLSVCNDLEHLATDRGASAAVRAQAIWTLVQLDQQRVQKLLGDLAKDSTGELTGTLLRVMEAHFANEPAALQTIDALLQHESNQSPVVAFTAALALSAWQGEAAGRMLGRLALQHRADENVVAATVNALAPGDKWIAYYEQLSADDALLDRVLERGAALHKKSWTGPQFAASVQQLADTGRWSSEVARLRRAIQLLRAVQHSAVTVDQQSRKVLQQLTDKSNSVIADTAQPIDLRIAATQLLILQDAWRSPTPENIDAYAGVMALWSDPKTAPELRSALYKALQTSRHFPFEKLLPAQWSDRTREQRQELLDLLASNEHATDALLKLLDPQFLLATDLDAARLQVFAKHPSAQVQQRVKQLTQVTIATDRVELVKQFQNVLKLTGDAAHGQAVFRKRCTACHRLGGEGREVGPDLASLTDKSSPSLLTSILDPNRAVETKYLEYSMVTTGGQLLSGVVTSETGTSITLVSADGKEHTVLRTELEILRPSNKSLMPEGLERDITRQELADVIAYLQKSAAPPKRFPGNEPALVNRDAEGRLVMTAANARIYGPTLIFESKYTNLGYWQSPGDYAAWSLNIPHEGHYRVEIDFACDASAAGNTLRLVIGDEAIDFKVPSTGTWDDYKRQDVGSVLLKPGETDASVRSQGELQHALIDLRSIRLIRIQ